MPAETRPEQLVPVRIAYILDGVVQDVVNTDDRLAALFLSDPLIIDVTEASESEFITGGYIYNQELNTFTKPPVIESQGPVTDVVTTPITPAPEPSENESGD